MKGPKLGRRLTTPAKHYSVYFGQFGRHSGKLTRFILQQDGNHFILFEADVPLAKGAAGCIDVIGDEPHQGLMAQVHRGHRSDVDSVE